MECKLWNCRWLAGDDTADLRRPDRSRYVIDVLPDVVRGDSDEGEAVMDVVQVWVDPENPEAWRDPAMIEYIKRRAAEGILTLIRYNEANALLVVSPPLGEWREIITQNNPDLLKVRKARHGY